MKLNTPCCIQALDIAGGQNISDLNLYMDVSLCPAECFHKVDIAVE